MDCEGWSLRPTPAGASLRKHHVISASLRSQREASRGRSRRLFAPKAARSTLPDQSEGVGSESNCGVAASVITRCRPGVELNDCEDDSFSARFPLVSPLNSHAATSSTRPISRSTSPDLGPRRATFACFQSQYAALAPSQRERSREDKCTNRSPSSSAEPRLDGYRPSFKVDWLCALRDELLCGVKQEAMVLREDFSRAVEDILNAVEFQMLSGVTQMQGTVCKTLEMDAQRAAFVSSDQLAMSSILERIGSMEADMRSLLERTGNVPPTAGIEASISSVIERLDSMKMEMGPVAVKLTNELSRVVDKSAHKERVAREKTIDITTKALDELKRARDDVDILKDLMSKLERRPHVDVSSIVAAIKPLVVSPAVDLKPMMVPIFQAVEEGVRPLSTMLSRLDARSQVDTDARSQVDSTQVLGVLADIKAMLSTISESTIESEAKLASVMDYSAIEKQLSDLGGVCAASHEKLSNIDTDLFRTELSALKRLSETSSEALGALVAQTDTRLPRPAESSNEAKAQIDLTPVLSALADQKIAISKLDDMASASESKLASMDYSVLEKKLNDVITACEARPQAERTSGLDARADQGLATPKANDAAVASQTRCALLDYSSMEHKLDGVLEACRRLQSHADFTPVLTALEQQTVAISNIEDVVTATKSLLASTDCSSLEGKIDTLVGVCGISQSQVDLSPVLTALAEQKASILSVNEVAVASEHRLASMDISVLDKKLNDLTRVCEASHEKVSSLDADVLHKELSALKCLSEASSHTLNAIATQTDDKLSRQARSDAENALSAPALSHADLSPVLTALAEQKASILSGNEVAVAAEHRLARMDISVLEKRLVDLTRVCEASHEKVSSLDADVLYKELSALKCLSEASSHTLNAIVTQTDDKLSRHARSDAENALSAPALSQVDLSPVLTALAEQKASILSVNEVAVAAENRLASIDISVVNKKLNDLARVCEASHEKVSSLDADVLYKELSALKCLSETSSHALNASQVDLSPVLTALAEQKASTRLASMDISVLNKKLNDLTRVCEASHEKVSSLDSDVLYKELSALKCLSETSSHTLNAIVTQTDDKLSRPARSDVENAISAPALSQVDLSPVLTALAEQKASILSVNEVAVAAEHRLASMDMSGLEKRLNDLTRICEASHEKVSSLDADMMFKELSALKCLSEASSDFLKSIVAQIEALLSRPARSDAESAIGAPALSQVDLSPVLTALAEQKAAISKIDEIATASRSRLESADYFVSGKQLNDAASADTRSQVDLAPVMSALAEQMAAIANLNEVCTAADTKLASIDYCDIGRKIDSLVSQSADLLDKLSTLDSDLLCKELAAFKSSSELSFQSLDAAVAQIGARLLQSPESGTKASCERQVHDEPVDSARYIDVIKETSEATMVAIEKANESIVHSLTLRTREIMQATSLSTSTVTASLKGLTATAGEILDQCCRPRTDADFISVLEAIKGLEEHTSSRLCATSEATLQAINNKMDRDDLRLVLEANSDTRAQLTQLLESVLDAARATDTTAKAVASQQAVASDAALKAIGDLASRPAVDLSPVLDALRAPNAQLDCSVSIKRNSDDAPDVRPDIDFGSLSDELRLGAERSSKLLVAFSDTAQKHTTDVDRMLSELAQCTAGLEACTEDAEGKEGASKALEAWTRSEQELMKVVHDVKADALQRLAGSISSGFLNSITAIADLSKVLSEVHDLVGDDATAAELRKGVEPLLDGVGYLRAKSSAFSPALEG